MVYPSGLSVYLVQHYPEWLTLVIRALSHEMVASEESVVKIAALICNIALLFPIEISATHQYQKYIFNKFITFEVIYSVASLSKSLLLSLL